jgi:hypothetical protein
MKYLRPVQAYTPYTRWNSTNSQQLELVLLHTPEDDFSARSRSSNLRQYTLCRYFQLHFEPVFDGPNYNTYLEPVILLAVFLYVCQIFVLYAII